MLLNMLFSLLCFTTFLHVSLGLAVPNGTLVNNTLVHYRSGIRAPTDLHKRCQSEEMLNCLTFYLDERCTHSYTPVTLIHPQSYLGFGILIGQTPNKANS